jgi:hypothetical protein
VLCCVQLEMSAEFLRSLEEDVLRRSKALGEAEQALRSEESVKQSSDAVETGLRNAIAAARGLLRTAEVELGKKLQLIQFKLESLSEARRQADV